MIRIVMRKSLMLLLIFIIAWSMFWPVQSTEAAVITDIRVTANTTYLIAGVKYAAYIKTDKASSTSMTTSISYSPNNSNVWVFLNNNYHSGTVPFTIIHLAVDVLDSDYNKYDAIIPFSIPINPDITTARIKVNTYYDPLIGSKSSSERVLGPYDIKQPGEPENLTAVSNNDGTVTLSWDDRTNMEKHYEIMRSGPDGIKKFYYEGTTDFIGQLTFHDKTTDKSKDTLYLYRITPIVDEKYSLPENLKMAGISKLVKTKAPITPSIINKVDSSYVLNMEFKNSDIVLSKIIDITQPVNPSEEEKKDLNIYKSYLDKIGTLPVVDTESIVNQYSVKGVSLDAAELKLKEGDTALLKAVIMPADAFNQNITWKSDNPTVATVDGNGAIKAVSEGTTIIKVQTEDGGYTATCLVTVESNQPMDDAPAIQFSDTQDHWAKDEIAQAVKLGIVYGYPDGTFRPEANVTRAEFSVMLMRALQSQIKVSPLNFKDKDKIGPWAVEYVQQAVAQGIIKGYTDATFRPNANISHAEMIAMVIRASGWDTNMGNQTSFVDDHMIPQWAKPSVVTAQLKGIVFGGINDNQFNPQANATRSESASSIIKMLASK